MTVGELKEALAEMPDDAEVYWNDGDFSYPAICFDEWYNENGELSECEDDKFEHAFVIAEELAGGDEDDK